MQYQQLPPNPSLEHLKSQAKQLHLHFFSNYARFLKKKVSI